jgi:heme-degrading monooxygenase HmoA
MIALYFEVLPRPGHEATYFAMAADLKPELNRHAGLIFLDRSRAVGRPGWIHQFWRDEAAMTSWRTNGQHHRAQACGRTDILADYRLRVGQVIATWEAGGPLTRVEVPVDATYSHPDGRPARFIVSALAGPEFKGPKVEAGEFKGGEADKYESVYDPALSVHVVGVRDEKAGTDLMARWSQADDLKSARLSLVSRDYGMFDRVEAPQHFDPVGLA